MDFYEGDTLDEAALKMMRYPLVGPGHGRRELSGERQATCKKTGDPMLKLLAYLAPIVTLVTIIALAVAGSFLTTSPVLIALYVAAIALGIAARRAFPPGAFRAGPPPAAPSIIRRGPYRVVRHPMYSAALLLVWTAVVAHLAAWTVGLGVVFTGTLVGRVRWEETLLRTRFPDYAEYARSTNALMPYVF